MVAKAEPAFNTCPVCLTEFRVGGAGNHKRTQIYCSNKCASKATGMKAPKTAAANRLTPVEAAYLAGMIDADGSIGYYRRKGINYRPYLGVTSTDHGMLEWILVVVGVGGIATQGKKPDGYKTVYQWQVTSTLAADVLQQISPYLRIKRHQADLMVEATTRLHTPRFRINISWQQRFKDLMTILNKTGTS